MAGDDSHCSQRSSQLQNFLVLFLLSCRHTLIFCSCRNATTHCLMQHSSQSQWDKQAAGMTDIILPMTASSTTWSEKTLQLQVKITENQDYRQSLPMHREGEILSTPGNKHLNCSHGLRDRKTWLIFYQTLMIDPQVLAQICLRQVKPFKV